MARGHCTVIAVARRMVWISAAGGDGNHRVSVAALSMPTPWGVVHNAGACCRKRILMKISPLSSGNKRWLIFNSGLMNKRMVIIRRMKNIFLLEGRI